MYRELLLVAFGAAPPAVGNPDELAAQLVAHHRQLAEAARAEGRVESDQSIADQIAYDLLLLALCAFHGIPCDARDFHQPLVERQRLEDELAALGVIDLGELRRRR